MTAFAVRPGSLLVLYTNIIVALLKQDQPGSVQDQHVCRLCTCGVRVVLFVATDAIASYMHHISVPLLTGGAKIPDFLIVC